MAESMMPLKPRLTFPQVLLCPFLLGDVPDDLGGSDDAPAAIPDRRYGQGDLDQAAVFAPAHCFVMVDTFAASQPGKNVAFLFQAVLRDQYSNGLANYFLSAITEQALGTLVPADDDTLQRFADDGVVGRFNNRGKFVNLFFHGFVLFDSAQVLVVSEI
jgi:hypothetical protein